MRVLLRVLLVGLVWVAVSGAAQARLAVPMDEMENPGVAVQQPDEILAFPQRQTGANMFSGPRSSTPNDIALSADGSRLVFTQDAEVLNVWWVIVWVWPEIVATLAGLLVLWGLWRVVRRRRRFPAERGPYCRKCAYETRDLASSECPECGKALAGKGTTRGIAWERTVATAVILFFAAACIVTVYGLTSPPRIGTVNDWFNWRSESLARSARGTNYKWLENLIRPTTAIRSVPIDDPKQVETIEHVPLGDAADAGWLPFIIINSSPPYTYQCFHFTNDRSLAVVCTHRYVSRIDLETLRPLSTEAIRAEEERKHTYIYGQLNDQADAYYARHMWTDLDRRLVSSETTKWALDGEDLGEVTITYEEPVRLEIMHRVTTMSHRVTSPNSGRPFEYRPATIIIEVGQVSDGQTLITASARGIRLRMHIANGYLVVQAGGMVYLYDLDTARWVAALDPTPIQNLGWLDGAQTAVSADRRWFAVRGHDGEKVAVYRLPEPGGGP